MKELLTKYNYTFSNSCNCDGFYIEKYNNGEYQVRLSEKKRIFKIKHKGRSITGWIPTDKLSETLQNIHEKTAKATVQA